MNEYGWPTVITLLLGAVLLGVGVGCEDKPRPKHPDPNVVEVPKYKVQLYMGDKVVQEWGTTWPPRNESGSDGMVGFTDFETSKKVLIPANAAVVTENY